MSTIAIFKRLSALASAVVCTVTMLVSGTAGAADESITYSADGKLLAVFKGTTASKNVSIEVPSKVTYDGTLHPASLSGSIDKFNALTDQPVSESDLVYTHSTHGISDPIAAGSYTVSLTRSL